MRKIILVLLLVFIYSNINSQNLLDIKPTGYVTDIEGVFTLDQKSDLENLLKSYEDSTSIQIFLVTSADFDFMYSTELGETWKVGQSGLNNGLIIIFSKAQRFCDMRTGYGLEEFLPDGWLKQIQSEVFPQYFKQELYYEGLKEYIVRIQNKIGYDGYDFLIQQKELKKTQHKEAVSNFFGWLLKVISTLLILFFVGYFVFIQYRKHHAYLVLKKDIINGINDIDVIYSYFNVGNMSLPSDLELLYNSRIHILKRKHITEEIKTHNREIYSSLVRYKQLLISLNKTNADIDSLYSYISNRNIILPKDIESLYISRKDAGVKGDLIKLTNIHKSLISFTYIINKVDELKSSIERKKKTVEQKLNKTYSYCDKSIKSDLISILEQIEIKDDYTNDNVKYLTGVETTIDMRLSAINSKVSNISEIISTKNAITDKIEYLRKENDIYRQNMNILQSVKIGNRFNSLNNINVDTKYIANILRNLYDSLNFLNDDNYEAAIKSYGTYTSELVVITSAFTKASNLISEYSKSESYVKSNTLKLNSYVSDIKRKINEDGVSYNRKSSLATLKSKVDTFTTNSISDYILASETLKSLLNELESLLRSVKSDINDEENRKRRKKDEEDRARRRREEQSRQSSYSSGFGSSSGGNSFGGGGGGSFGGGGSGSGW